MLLGDSNDCCLWNEQLNAVFKISADCHSIHRAAKWEKVFKMSTF